jgi:hypothetical protein
MKMMIEFLWAVLVFVLFFGAITLYSGAMLPKLIRHERPVFDQNPGLQEV